MSDDVEALLRCLCASWLTTTASVAVADCPRTRGVDAGQVQAECRQHPGGGRVSTGRSADGHV